MAQLSAARTDVRLRTADKPAMEKASITPGAEARFAQRLPQLITMFFSFTMVGFFKTFTDTFHFTTGPAIDWRDPSQVLILVSFLMTLFWIVTAWLGYSVLIERRPYTADLGRFFFDVARFSLLNFQMNFSFLAGQISSFQVYIFSIALWHGMMAGWYVQRFGRAPSEAKDEVHADAASHGVRFATYVALGLVYYFEVALRPDQPGAQVLRIAIAALTFGVMFVWNATRIRNLTVRILTAS